jgi:hypothetical protein
MPVILATQEAEIKRILVQSQPRQIVHKTLSQKTFTKIGLLEWLKVEALSSSPVPPKKKKKRKKLKMTQTPWIHQLEWGSCGGNN